MQVRLASGLPRRFAIRRSLVIRTCSFTSATVSPPSPLQSCAGRPQARQNRSERLPESPALLGCCVSQDVLMPGPFVRNARGIHRPRSHPPPPRTLNCRPPLARAPRAISVHAQRRLLIPAPRPLERPHLLPAHPLAVRPGPGHTSHHRAAAPTNPTPRAPRARTQCTPRTISYISSSRQREQELQPPGARVRFSLRLCVCVPQRYSSAPARTGGFAH